MGLQLFGGKLYDDEGVVPRANFDSFDTALLTTFQILTLDNWSDVMLETARIYGPWSTIYFGCWIMLGTWVLANLLLVSVLDAYAVIGDKMKQQVDQREVSRTAPHGAFRVADSELVTSLAREAKAV